MDLWMHRVQQKPENVVLSCVVLEQCCWTTPWSNIWVDPAMASVSSDKTCSTFSDSAHKTSYNCTIFDAKHKKIRFRI